MKSNWKVNIKNRSGNIIGALELHDLEDGVFTVEICVAEEPVALPEHSNPLHKDALSMGDLKQGMNIIRHNIHLKTKEGYATGLIIGEPFKRGDCYNDFKEQSWMLPVVTTNDTGDLVQEDWSMADMGIVPYGDLDNSFWNDQNYTLAAN